MRESFPPKIIQIPYDFFKYRDLIKGQPELPEKSSKAGKQGQSISARAFPRQYPNPKGAEDQRKGCPTVDPRRHPEQKTGGSNERDYPQIQNPDGPWGIGRK